MGGPVLGCFPERGHCCGARDEDLKTKHEDVKLVTVTRVLSCLRGHTTSVGNAPN